jgi:NADH:ubiquinone oxidoreductase subunit F (NADH-binding)
MRELIAEFCGGMQDGHEFYGYFPGGASGGILPESMADIPMDFDTLNEHGCFIGSAAVVVFSKQDSAKELAINAMKFFEEESCGQCTPCRVGTAISCEKYLIAQRRGLGAACPKPQIDASTMTEDNSSSKSVSQFSCSISTAALAYSGTQYGIGVLGAGYCRKRP